MPESANDLFIEISTLISSNIQIKRGRSKLMITKDYRVLGLKKNIYIQQVVHVWAEEILG